METVLPFEFYIDFFCKCIFSLVLGGYIGYERAVLKKPAGIKTHALICLGAAVISYLSFHFAANADPSRIAAQIVSGIGFIGAGTIFVSKEGIQGLTSAATVWVCAAIGMLIGSNFTLLALIAVGTIHILFKFSKPQFSSDLKTHMINIRILDWNVINHIHKLIAHFNIRVHSQSMTRKKGLELRLYYKATPVIDYFFFKKYVV